MGMTYTPDKIKPHILMFTMMAQGIVMMLPPEAKNTVKNVLDIVTGLIQQDWFLELFCTLLNIFEDGKATREEIAAALETFSNKIKTSNNSLIAFPVVQ